MKLSQARYRARHGHRHRAQGLVEDPHLRRLRGRREGPASAACSTGRDAEIALARTGAARAWIYPNADEQRLLPLRARRPRPSALAGSAPSLDPPPARIGPRRQRVGARPERRPRRGRAAQPARRRCARDARPPGGRADDAVLARRGPPLVDDASAPRLPPRSSRGSWWPTARGLGLRSEAGEPRRPRGCSARACSAALADLADDPWVLAEAEKRAAAWLAESARGGRGRRADRAPRRRASRRREAVRRAARGGPGARDAGGSLAAWARSGASRIRRCSAAGSI